MKKNMVKLSQEELSVMAVMAYEKKQGRKPIDVSKDHVGYDVKSGKRLIEVKSKPKGRPPYISLYGGLLKKLGRDVSNYYIYIVWDFGPKTKITILSPKDIFSNLEIFSQYRIPGKAFSKLDSINIGKI